MKYRVIKDIRDGWEGSAKVGDILHVGNWEGQPTLFKYDKAICDVDSPYALECCESIEEEEV